MRDMTPSPHRISRAAGRPRVRRVRGVLALVLGLLAAAPAAQAATTTGCDDQPLSRPFLPFLDPALYTPVTDGGFEAGGVGWKLTGGAGVVAGNESFQVGGAADTRSLRLPSGSSATSAPLCIGVLHPTARLFVRNTGLPLSTLAVEAIVTDRTGILSRLPIGVVAAGPAWTPTLPLPILQNLTAALDADGTVDLQLRLTPVGLGGSWQIDDVYVDPYKVD